MLPKVSIVIPTINEERNIKLCLDSIFQQNYPKEKLEVIVVDDYSTDKTLQIVKNYHARILFSGQKHGEISKMIGFKAAKGELVMYLDADIELASINWLKDMVKPLIEDKTIIGSFTRYYSKENTPAIERYLNFDALQRDSIYRYFSPTIESTIVADKKNYFVCEYTLEKIPPAGLCLYRRKELMHFVKDYKMFLELDFLVLLVSKGLNRFAYVPKAGLYHRHVSNLRQLLKKRKYNLQKVYLAREKRLYTWFDIGSFLGKMKISVWIVYANLILPSLLVGLYKSAKYKDLAGMYEPVVNFCVTNLIIFNFLMDRRGRKLLHD